MLLISRHFGQVIEIDPKYAMAYYNRAILYFGKQEYDKAWEDVHKAESLGSQVSPKFLKALREVSGRERGIKAGNR